ncbi:MAG: RrF2 family transcriptional regulator [Planctomycetota bacterium]|jgi:Rrf2 family protein
MATPEFPMIRFSKMADYGVLLLGHFAQAGEALTSSTALAEAYHMPRPVVANLLKEFCKVGLLESRRGLHGGYRLAKSPSEITLLDVLSAVDGPVQLIDCAIEELQACGYEDVCPSRSPMRQVHRRIVGFLGGITLTELMDEHTESTAPLTRVSQR